MTAIAIIQQSCADSLTVANLRDGVYGRDSPGGAFPLRVLVYILYCILEL
jgi:hypothetical protein